MSGIPIQALAQLPAVTAGVGIEGAGPAAGAAAGASGPSFGAMVTEGLSRLNGELLGSQADAQQLAVGDVQNLHQIMIRMEESRLSFELMMRVRNRLLEAYQDLMKMQV